MRTTDMREQNVHEGRNVKRIREILGIKQDALAIDLGITQQAISLLEQKETIDAPVLEKIAKSLRVSVEAIRTYNDAATISIVANTFQDFHDNAHASAMDYQCSFNPLDKVIELYKEKEAMYERMLQEKEAMIVRLEALLKGK
ncbi:helix-turn-helix domain-containing protein [Chitinophagaceae bacterium MMS25-I14]